MAIVYKVLGQSAPAAITLTTLYTAPALTSAVVSTLVVCNLSVTAARTFRVAVRPAGASITQAHYLYYDVEIPARDTFVTTIGITLATTDVVSVYASSTELTFSLFGSELT